MGLQTTMYRSIARTTSDQRATSPVREKKEKSVFHVCCAMSSSREFPASSFLTSECSHEPLDGAESGSEDEVAIHSRCDGDGESEGAHDQSSHSQVDQDVVERLPELLVLSRYQQCQTVDGSSSADQEEHVESQKLVNHGIHHVVLRVFKRTSNDPTPVGHGDVEVLALSAIGLDSAVPNHLDRSVVLLSFFS